MDRKSDGDMELMDAWCYTSGSGLGYSGDISRLICLPNLEYLRGSAAVPSTYKARACHEEWVRAEFEGDVE